MSFNITQTNTLNSNRQNLRKDAAALQTRCKPYFSVKL